MNILVTGGTGFIGRHLVYALTARGHNVRVLGRNKAQLQEFTRVKATSIAADLRNRQAVADACAGVDAVYHVGAYSAPWGKRDDFFAINVGGTQAVVDACQQHGVRRLIYVSSPSVLFNGKDQHNLTDDAPYPRRFSSTYSLTKKLGEDIVQASTNLDYVILRPKAVFGPGDQSLLPRLIQAARAGRLPQIGDGKNFVDLTYVENVVDALLCALEAPAAVGKSFTITNDEHVRLWDVIRHVLRELNISPNLRVVPLHTALAAAALMEARALFSGVEPLLTRYTTLILARTQTYDTRAIKRDLGYTPRISVAQGVDQTLASFRSAT